MTVLNYMRKLRKDIEAKHIGETFLLNAEGEAVEVPQRSTYDILSEIDAMQGLNVKERFYADISARCHCEERSDAAIQLISHSYYRNAHARQ